MSLDFCSIDTIYTGRGAESKLEKVQHFNLTQ